MATQIAIMIYAREQADGRVNAHSIHGFLEEPSQYPFFWTDASAADANATMNSAERAAAVDEMARADEESRFYRYVQINQDTAGFPLYHHTPEGRDAILLTKYFTRQETAGANLIAPWVLTLSVDYIAQVLILSLEEAQRILDRADHLQNTLRPEVQKDELWQAGARRAAEAREGRLS